MSKNEIVLIHPAHRSRLLGTPEEHLGLGYIAAVLQEAGIGVTIIDAALTGMEAKEVVALTRQLAPRLVGISVLYQIAMPDAAEVARGLRDARVEAPIVLGGHFPTFEAERILERFPDIDGIVAGEGEHTFLELAKLVLGGTPFFSLPPLEGLVTREVRGEPRPLEPHLDSFPHPNRDTLPLALKAGSKAAMITSRGCYGRCSFCSIRTFYESSPGPLWRARSAGDIVDEMEKLHKDMGVSAIGVSDDNFIGPGRKGRARAREIAEEIMRRNLSLKFAISCRADDVDEELFKLLVKAGMYEVFLGLESGVQAVLDRFNKGVTVEQNIRAMETLHRLNIKPRIGFIMFDPDTTLEEVTENVQFLRQVGVELGSSGNLTDVLNRLQVFSGTPIERRLQEEGRLLGDFLQYDYEFTDRRIKMLYPLLLKVQDASLFFRRFWAARAKNR